MAFIFLYFLSLSISDTEEEAPSIGKVKIINETPYIEILYPDGYIDTMSISWEEYYNRKAIENSNELE